MFERYIFMILGRSIAQPNVNYIFRFLRISKSSAMMLSSKKRVSEFMWINWMFSHNASITIEKNSHK